MGLSQAAAVDSWVVLWPMKRSGRTELDHTWRGTPSGHQFCLQKKGEERRRKEKREEEWDISLSVHMPQGKSKS